jgi:hypothetical protein
LEASSWQRIGVLTEEWLILRVAAPEAVELDAAAVQLDLAADQPMRPARIERKGVAQEHHRAGLSGASEEDEAARRHRLQIELPGRRNGWAWRRVRQARGAPPSRRS